jgi:uncharacterized delta-60 repeat protein
VKTARLPALLAVATFAPFAAAQATQDLTFASAGLTRAGRPDANERWNDVRVQSDGRIVVAGVSGVGLFGGPGEFLVGRYLSTGVPDPSFNGTGLVNVPLRGAKSVVVLPDQSLLVAGDGSLATQTLDGLVLAQSGSSPADIHIARLTPNGALDPTFGVAGLVRTDLTGGRIDTAERLVAFPDGRFWVVGAASGSGAETLTDWAITAYRANGTIETAFGTGGRVGISLGQAAGSATALDAVLVAGSVVIVGTSGPELVAARVNGTTGALDPSFGTAGLTRVSIQNGQPSSTLRGTSVIALPDGRLFINGNTTFFDSDPGELSNPFAYAVRLTSGGQIDPTFNAFPTFAYIASPGSSARLVGGRVLLSIASTNLIRLNENGSVDTSFSATGESGIFRPSTASAFVFDNLAVQNDGRLVVAGASLFTAPAPQLFQTDASIIRVNTGAAPPLCRIDFDVNNLREPADVFAFLTAYFNPSSPIGLIDFNCNGARSPADIFAFLTAYFANSCSACP